MHMGRRRALGSARQNCFFFLADDRLRHLEKETTLPRVADWRSKASSMEKTMRAPWHAPARARPTSFESLRSQQTIGSAAGEHTHAMKHDGRALGSGLGCGMLLGDGPGCSHAGGGPCSSHETMCARGNMVGRRICRGSLVHKRDHGGPENMSRSHCEKSPFIDA